MNTSVQQLTFLLNRSVAGRAIRCVWRVSSGALVGAAHDAASPRAPAVGGGMGRRMSGPLQPRDLAGAFLARGAGGAVHVLLKCLNINKIFFLH